MEGLRGTAVPHGPGPPADGTGSLAQAAFDAYGGPTGDGSSQLPGPTIWGDGESCPGNGRRLWRACGGRQFPMAQAHHLGGRKAVPRWWSVPMEGLWGTAVPNGPGPPSGGTRSRALAAIGAYGGPAGDGSSQRPRPTSWGGGESCQGGGRGVCSAFGGRQFPTARTNNSGTGIVAQTAVGAYGAHVGDGCSEPPQPTRLGQRGVLPRRR